MAEKNQELADRSCIDELRNNAGNAYQYPNEPISADVALAMLLDDIDLGKTDGSDTPVQRKELRKKLIDIYLTYRKRFDDNRCHCGRYEGFGYNGVCALHNGYPFT